MLVPFNQQLITTGFIDTVNDPVIMSIQSQAAGIPSPYVQNLGVIMWMDHRQAAQVSSSTTNPQAGGYYQYVKANTALARGDIVAWLASGGTGTVTGGLETYTVTHTFSAGLEGEIAGFALGTVTAGNFCWIQVGGLGYVKYRATVTSKVIGNIVLQLTTTATADAIADATGTYISGGTLGLKNIIGSAYDTPADGGTLRVVMKNIALNI